MKTLREMIDLVESAQTGGNYELKLVSHETVPDPEDYATMIAFEFDVYKDGKKIGEASGNDYFGRLWLDINGKETQLDTQTDSNNPLIQQFQQYRQDSRYDNSEESLDETEDPIKKIEELFKDKY